MKKILFIFFVILCAFACTKNNDILPNPEPEPIPDTTQYKSEITLKLIVPENVGMYLGNSCWVLRSDKNQITNRIQVSSALQIIVLTGDSVKEYLGKKVYLYFRFAKEISYHTYSYHVRKSFILKPEVELIFVVSANSESEYYIDP